MAISLELRQRARAQTQGLTDLQVMELTGLAKSTLRKIMTGEITGPDKLVQFAEGLKDDPSWYLQEWKKFTKPGDVLSTINLMLMNVYELSPLECLQVISMIREFSTKKSNKKSA